MIKTIILDIGFVLVDYDWQLYLSRLFSEPTTVSIVKDALFDHGVWDELDRGVWTRDELIRGFLAPAPAYRQQILEAFERAGEALTMRPYACSWIRELKDRGYQVLYLSNWSEHIWNCSQHALDFFPLFDDGIFSYKVNLIKPEPAIYRLLLNRFSLTAGECVFIDDSPANVAAAQAQGIHAIHFTDYASARAQLETLLKKSKKD